MTRQMFSGRVSPPAESSIRRRPAASSNRWRSPTATTAQALTASPSKGIWSPADEWSMPGCLCI